MLSVVYDKKSNESRDTPAEKQECREENPITKNVRSIIKLRVTVWGLFNEVVGVLSLSRKYRCQYIAPQRRERQAAQERRGNLLRSARDEDTTAGRCESTFIRNTSDEDITLLRMSSPIRLLFQPICKL